MVMRVRIELILCLSTGLGVAASLDPGCVRGGS